MLLKLIKNVKTTVKVHFYRKHVYKSKMIEKYFSW